MIMRSWRVSWAPSTRNVYIASHFRAGQRPGPSSVTTWRRSIIALVAIVRWAMSFRLSTNSESGKMLNQTLDVLRVLMYHYCIIAKNVHVTSRQTFVILFPLLSFHH